MEIQELKGNVDEHLTEIETLNDKLSKLKIENQNIKEALDNADQANREYKRNEKNLKLQIESAENIVEK